MCPLFESRSYVKAHQGQGEGETTKNILLVHLVTCVDRQDGLGHDQSPEIVSVNVSMPRPVEVSLPNTLVDVIEIYVI